MRISYWSSDVVSSDLDGLTEADFQLLLALMQNGYGWLKMSAPYRLAKKRGMEPVNEIAKAIVAADPDRAIWGSDWPHIPCGAHDTGILLNLLPTWAPDTADIKTILSDNPKTLMGFIRCTPPANPPAEHTRTEDHH